jgi:hypothetical protein
MKLDVGKRRKHTVDQLPHSHMSPRVEGLARKGQRRWDKLVIKPRGARENPNHDGRDEGRDCAWSERVRRSGEIDREEPYRAPSRGRGGGIGLAGLENCL